MYRGVSVVLTGRPGVLAVPEHQCTLRALPLRIFRLAAPSAISNVGRTPAEEPVGSAAAGEEIGSAVTSDLVGGSVAGDAVGEIGALNPSTLK